MDDADVHHLTDVPLAALEDHDLVSRRTAAEAVGVRLAWAFAEHLHALADELVDDEAEPVLGDAGSKRLLEQLWALDKLPTAEFEILEGKARAAG